ncbi:putative DNA helicase [Spironucleus salmonicida]|uniref:DNA helicase n=1 Tax=Spironucleus salmonicida TaxID=348837 RepID=V6LXI7_9EUKA|nr:putative DNA helicase [Spironucleus salmonicida]|eukprot:EST48963.1 Nonsense-ediated mRNA decay protein [Spironucleus salmonicida]
MKCEYCDLTSKFLLARCTKCNLHFCNSQLNEKSISHILRHIKETSHTSFEFPYKGIPCCKDCGRENIVSLYKDIDESYLCRNHKTEDSFSVISKNKVLFLLGTPSKELIEEYKNLENLNETAVAKAHIKKIEQQLVCDVSDRQRELDLLNSQLFIIPQRFPQCGQDVKMVSNMPYLQFQFQQEIQDGAIIIEDELLVAVNNPTLQQKINSLATKIFTYSDFMIKALKVEFLTKDIQIEQGKQLLSTTAVQFRTKDGQLFEAFFSWPRYQRLCNQIIRPGDEICLEVQMAQGQVHILTGLIRSVDDTIIVKLYSAPPKVCLQVVIHEANKIELNSIKLSENATSIHNILFNDHDVFRADDDVIYSLKYSQTNFMMHLMISTIKYINFSSEINLKILKGEGDIQSLLKEAKCYIPQLDNVQNIITSVKADLDQVHCQYPNEYQTLAIKTALTNSISLIQGCPGGGKTYTSAILVLCLLKQYNDQQILCCTGSNIAADNIALFCHKVKANVLRIYAKSREEFNDQSVSPELKSISLHNIIRSNVRSNSYVNNNVISQDLNDSINQYFILNIFMSEENTGKYVYDAYKDLEEYEISKADVIISTCGAVNSDKIRLVKFAALILDESSQVLEVESIMPISIVPKHFILVGDQNQLGPVVEGTNAKASQFGRSLYQRFINLGIKPIRLLQQYRMHPGLLEFPNEQFYYGQIKSVVDINQRTFKTNSCQPIITKKFPPNFPSLFWSLQSEESQDSSMSYYNNVEADSVLSMIQQLLIEYKINQQNIGIITPYAAQQSLLKNQLVNYPQIEVNSVDGFQGREKDVIIFSAVRSNDKDLIGFLHQKNRVNVAFTRARNMFIIIGNATHLSKPKGIWRDVIQFYQDKSALFVGTQITMLTLASTQTIQE